MVTLLCCVTGFAPATHDLRTVTIKRVQFHICFLCRTRTKNTWVSQRFPTRCTASLSRRASTSRSWLQVRNFCSSARVRPSEIPLTLFLTDVLALKGSLAWESPPWSTASFSQICTKIGSCSTPKVRLPQHLTPRTFAFHDRIPKQTLVFFLFAERITQTVEITKHTVDIEEKGVKLKLTIVDTPGFGDAVNNTEWYKSAKKKLRIPKRIHR